MGGVKILENIWEYNVVGVYDYKSPGHLSDWYELVVKNIESTPGDLVEAGVFTGKSLIGTSLLITRITKH